MGRLEVSSAGYEVDTLALLPNRQDSPLFGTVGRTLNPTPSSERAEGKTGQRIESRVGHLAACAGKRHLVAGHERQPQGIDNRIVAVRGDRLLVDDEGGYTRQGHYLIRKAGDGDRKASQRQIVNLNRAEAA